MPPKRKTAPAPGTWSKAKTPRTTNNSNRQAESEDEQEEEVTFQGQERGTLQNEMAKQVSSAVAQAVPAAIAQMAPIIAQQVMSQLDGSEQTRRKNQKENDQKDEDDASVLEAVTQHISSMTSKHENSDLDSDDDDDECGFTYALVDSEVDKIYNQEYVDFGKIYRRCNKLKAQSDKESTQKENSNSDVPIDSWTQIFLAFMAEHVVAFPQDAPAMPKYLELILKMAAKNMDWQRYDEVFRMSRAKKVRRGKGKKLRKWSKQNLPLYLECGTMRMSEHKTGQNNKQWFSQSKKESVERRSGTCWRFQEGECKGACAWPLTHQCYNCGLPHPTKDCGKQEGEKEKKSAIKSVTFREEESSSEQRYSHERSRESGSGHHGSSRRT